MKQTEKKRQLPEHWSRGRMIRRRRVGKVKRVDVDVDLVDVGVVHHGIRGGVD